MLRTDGRTDHNYRKASLLTCYQTKIAILDVVQIVYYCMVFIYNCPRIGKYEIIWVIPVQLTSKIKPIFTFFFMNNFYKAIQYIF